MRSQGIECSDALDLGVEEGEGIRVEQCAILRRGMLWPQYPNSHASPSRPLLLATSSNPPIWMAFWDSASLSCTKEASPTNPLGPVIFNYSPTLNPYPCSGPWTKSTLFSPALSSTRQIVREDKALVYQDWKHCILPLTTTLDDLINPNYFTLEYYFAAKSLVASRSFEIDEHHGSGMVPFADLFNHKTGAEDVHFTDNYVEDERSEEYAFAGDDEPVSQDALSSESSEFQLKSSPTLEDEVAVLEMIMVKDVKAGAEVFNTYGTLGNAALLHRCGFTEPDNPFDIVNIDLELVLQWSSSLFSSRHGRSRLSLWRRLDYSGCASQNSEYFEISYGGEPQIELLILLYIILLPEEMYCRLDLMLSTVGDLDRSLCLILPNKVDISMEKSPDVSKDLLLTMSVCDALLSLADIRDNLYGPNWIEEDINILNKCPVRERKMYHSLMLRVSERKILGKLRTYAAAAGGRSLKTAQEPIRGKR